MEGSKRGKIKGGTPRQTKQKAAGGKKKKKRGGKGGVKNIYIAR